MSTITLGAYEGVGITLIIIASALVGIRIFVNYRMSHHKLAIEDCVPYLSLSGGVWLTCSRFLRPRLVFLDRNIRGQRCYHTR